MRVMVLGAAGMLGRDLIATAPPDFTLFPFTHVDLDITDTAALESRIADVQPDVIVNAAAYTAVDKAEAERDLAFRVNGDAVGVLGQLAAQAGARVVHFSTDYVFDGSAATPYHEDAPTRPVNWYGASKLAGEQALRSSGAQFLLIRTQWLFGAHGRSFPKTMWDRARQGLATRVVADQAGRPSYARDIAQATWRLTELVSTGVFHIANTGVASWYEVARCVFRSAGRVDLVAPCTTAEYVTSARRPRYSVLDTSKLEELLRNRLPRWSTALGAFIALLNETHEEHIRR